MFNTFSDSYVLVAQWISIAALSLALILILQLALLRFSLMRTTRQQQQFTALWQPVLVETLVVGVPSALPALPAARQLQFMGLWLKLQESVRGAESYPLQALAYQLGCDSYARQFLTSGRHSTQLLAIKTIGYLGDRCAWDSLLQRVDEPDGVKALCAARALMQIDEIRAAPLLMPKFLTHKDWPVAQIATILRRSPEAFAPLLQEALQLGQGAERVRALHFMALAKLSPPLPLLAALLSPTADVEILLAALRLPLPPLLLPQVRALPSHADWRVRVQSAKVLGRIGDMQDIARLAALLCDPEWWVRYRAAEALIGLPFMDQAQLQNIYQALDDRFAQDMLLKVQSEHERKWLN